MLERENKTFKTFKAFKKGRGNYRCVAVVVVLKPPYDRPTLIRFLKNIQGYIRGSFKGKIYYFFLKVIIIDCI